MSEMQIKKSLKYSKSIIHPSWRPLLAGDDNSLRYIGTGNLQMMLNDWKLLLKACEVALKVSKKSGRSGCCNSFYDRTIMNARRAIPLLENLMVGSVSKPIFATHRPLDYFKVGDKVFVCMEDEDNDKVRPFIPAVIEEPETFGELAFKAGKGKRAFTAYIDVRNPYILSEADMIYLSANSDYLMFFSRMGDLEADGEDDAYEELVLKAGFKYYPDLEPCVSRFTPNICFSSEINIGGVPNDRKRSAGV